MIAVHLHWITPLAVLVTATATSVVAVFVAQMRSKVQAIDDAVNNQAEGTAPMVEKVAGMVEAMADITAGQAEIVAEQVRVADGHLAADDLRQKQIIESSEAVQRKVDELLEHDADRDVLGKRFGIKPVDEPSPE